METLMVSETLVIQSILAWSQCPKTGITLALIQT